MNPDLRKFINRAYEKMLKKESIAGMTGIVKYGDEADFSDFDFSSIDNVPNRFRISSYSNTGYGIIEKCWKSFKLSGIEIISNATVKMDSKLSILEAFSSLGADDFDGKNYQNILIEIISNKNLKNENKIKFVNIFLDKAKRVLTGYNYEKIILELLNLCNIKRNKKFELVNRCLEAGRNNINGSNYQTILEYIINNSEFENKRKFQIFDKCLEFGKEKIEGYNYEKIISELLNNKNIKNDKKIEYIKRFIECGKNTIKGLNYGIIFGFVYANNDLKDEEKLEILKATLCYKYVLGICSGIKKYNKAESDLKRQVIEVVAQKILDVEKKSEIIKNGKKVFIDGLALNRLMDYPEDNFSLIMNLIKNGSDLNYISVERKKDSPNVIEYIPTIYKATKIKERETMIPVIYSMIDNGVEYEDVEYIRKEIGKTKVIPVLDANHCVLRNIVREKNYQELIQKYSRMTVSEFFETDDVVKNLSRYLDFTTNLAGKKFNNIVSRVLEHPELNPEEKAMLLKETFYLGKGRLYRENYNFMISRLYENKEIESHNKIIIIRECLNKTIKDKGERDRVLDLLVKKTILEEQAQTIEVDDEEIPKDAYTFNKLLEHGYLHLEIITFFIKNGTNIVFDKKMNYSSIITNVILEIPIKRDEKVDTINIFIELVGEKLKKDDFKKIIYKILEFSDLTEKETNLISGCIQDRKIDLEVYQGVINKILDSKKISQNEKSDFIINCIENLFKTDKKHDNRCLENMISVANVVKDNSKLNRDSKEFILNNLVKKIIEHEDNTKIIQGKDEVIGSGYGLSFLLDDPEENSDLIMRFIKNGSNLDFVDYKNEANNPKYIPSIFKVMIIPNDVQRIEFEKAMIENGVNTDVKYSCIDYREEISKKRIIKVLDMNKGELRELLGEYNQIENR